MAVNSSPRLRDSLDFEDPDTVDPRLSGTFRTLSIDSAGYEDHELFDDHRPFAGTLDPAAGRRRRKQRQSDFDLDHVAPFEYKSVADGDAFRLVVVYSGQRSDPIQCSLIWESSKWPKREYRCLSYCWETVVREATIYCDGYRFPVTRNLFSALQNLRKPTANLLIWIDQICINQDDVHERGHQVSIMKNIFNQAKEVIVWLGEGDDRSEKLCEYARKFKRTVDLSPRTALNRILGPRQLQDAIQKLLQRPWFSRCWVIPEVALARFTVVACGRSHISWDNLVRLIRDVPAPQLSNSDQRFDKQTDLLGNPRQRIAIITQMIASQRQGLVHTDITQLMILAKASKATDVRDMVYAFYGITLLTTFPDYARSVPHLYADIAHMYVNSILYEDYYSSWHALDEGRKTQQLMSILYSAGALHQHYTSLPSWVPDWTYSWHLAPVWCQTTPNMTTNAARDNWTAGVRSEYRAGSPTRETFEVVPGPRGVYHLRVSVLLFDQIATVSETTPASTPSAADDTEHALASLSSAEAFRSTAPQNLYYGRVWFRTSNGLVGIATEGVRQGDALAVLLGGDVPVVLRRVESDGEDGDGKGGGGEKGGPPRFRLLCECFVHSHFVMSGGMVGVDRALAEDVLLV